MIYSELAVFCLFPEPPEVTVFPKNPVELGQPNVLICHIDRLFPPVLNVTWLRNGQPVTEGTSETVFLASTELRFHKFHYLTTAQDVYDCRVEHWSLDQPSLSHWGKQHPLSTHPCSQELVPQHPTMLTASIHFPQKCRSQSRCPRQWRPRSAPWAWWWAWWAPWLVVRSS